MLCEPAGGVPGRQILYAQWGVFLAARHEWTPCSSPVLYWYLSSTDSTGTKAQRFHDPHRGASSPCLLCHGAYSVEG